MMEESKEERDPWITATAVHVVCSSENGDIQAVFRQSDAQRQLYDLFGELLIIDIIPRSTNKAETNHSNEFLLVIMVVTDMVAGTGVSVCLVSCSSTLISAQLLSSCMSIFTSLNNPVRARSVIVGKEELLPVVRTCFPAADHLLSLDLLLQQVKKDLSHCLQSEELKRLCDAFSICCTTCSELDFGYAESLLTSVDRGVGRYFADHWFQETELWRAIDRVRYVHRRGIDIRQTIEALQLRLEICGFYSFKCEEGENRL